MEPIIRLARPEKGSADNCPSLTSRGKHSRDIIRQKSSELKYWVVKNTENAFEAKKTTENRKRISVGNFLSQDCTATREEFQTIPLPRNRGDILKPSVYSPCRQDIRIDHSTPGRVV